MIAIIMATIRNLCIQYEFSIIDVFNSWILSKYINAKTKHYSDALEYFAIRNRYASISIAGILMEWNFVTQVSNLLVSSMISSSTLAMLFRRDYTSLCESVYDIFVLLFIFLKIFYQSFYFKKLIIPCNFIILTLMNIPFFGFQERHFYFFS